MSRATPPSGSCGKQQESGVDELIQTCAFLMREDSAWIDNPFHKFRRWSCGFTIYTTGRCGTLLVVDQAILSDTHVEETASVLLAGLAQRLQERDNFSWCCSGLYVLFLV